MNEHDSDSSKNYQALLEKGNAYFEIENWSEALRCYQLAEDLKPTFKGNIALVKTWQALDKPSKAVEIAAQYEDVYLNNGDQWCEFYIRTLVLNHEFIAAMKYLSLLQNEGTQSRLKQWIHQQEVIVLEDQKAAIHRKIRQSFELVNGTNQENVALIVQLKQLPLPAYLKMLIGILDNDFVHPLYKADLLNFIAFLKIDQSLEISWFEQKRKIILNQLPTTHHTVCFLVTKDEIEQRLFADPILQKAAIEILNLQCLMLYPFADEVIQQPKDWANGLLQYYQFLPEVGDGVAQGLQVIQWQKRLAHLVDELIN